ncbi:helix-turn-helix domain-containing protein [Chitiniphilus shinanonensis]|uniref:helix-turn-helix domain-containing protein n=1 Tax=Chitiniphilus shinanonensis TaxID=553088 RepID=UPI00306D06BE
MTTTAKPLMPARRALQALWVLQGHSFDGLRLTQIAERLGDSLPVTHRLLHVMADEGVVERIPGRDDFWRLTPRLVQVARAHQDECHRLQAATEEFNQRYSRAPR